jgi:DNA-binding SARP family transcriptional activator
VEFRILGPLEVADGYGGAISIDAPKQRVLLSVLLLHPNEVVSSERLIDELWGERSPATAIKLVQTYVSQLRKTIGPDAIATRPPGYLLRVEEDALDAARFRRLAAEARRLASSGRPERADALYREALGLWRGPPVADIVFESFARNEVDRLEEERLGTVVERIACELALGRNHELIPELEMLVGEYPLRERLRAQLMLALYRTGRQADALTAYQEARRVLVDELGIEPSQELQSLEHAILQHDPVLELRPPPQSPPLPVPSTSFVGRAEEVGALEALIGGPEIRLVSIVGVAGVGKTRLAIAVCERLADSFADGIFFVSLAPTRDPRLVAAAIAEAVGAVVAPQEAVGDALVRSLKDRSAVLVLDNFEHVLDAAAIVPDLLTRTRGVEILITSREPLHVSGEHVFRLGALAESEAVELFESRARATRHDFESDESVVAICRALDGLPLALELAAARVNVLSLHAIAGLLQRRLRLLTGGPRDAPERLRSLAAAIEWSYRLLTPEEQRVFAGLSVFVGGCALEAAEEVCQADLDVLGSLVDKSLVHVAGDRDARGDSRVRARAIAGERGERRAPATPCPLPA